MAPAADRVVPVAIAHAGAVVKVGAALAADVPVSFVVRGDDGPQAAAFPAAGIPVLEIRVARPLALGHGARRADDLTGLERGDDQGIAAAGRAVPADHDVVGLP